MQILMRSCIFITAWKGAWYETVRNIGILIEHCGIGPLVLEICCNDLVCINMYIYIYTQCYLVDHQLGSDDFCHICRKNAELLNSINTTYWLSDFLSANALVAVQCWDRNKTFKPVAIGFLKVSRRNLPTQNTHRVWSDAYMSAGDVSRYWSCHDLACRYALMYHVSSSWGSGGL